MVSQSLPVEPLSAIYCGDGRFPQAVGFFAEPLRIGDAGCVDARCGGSGEGGLEKPCRKKPGVEYDIERAIFEQGGHEDIGGYEYIPAAELIEPVPAFHRVEPRCA